MRRPLSRLTAVAAAGAVVALAGCGSSSTAATPNDPKGKLSASVSNLTDSDALTVTLKLEASAAALQQLARSQKQTLSAADAQAIAGLNVIFATKTTNGQKLSAIKPGSSNSANVSVQVVDSGRSLAELRVVDGNLYLKGDVRTILNLAHRSATYAQLQARAQKLPGFVQALIAGKWVSLSGDALKGLASQFGVTPSQSPGTSQSQKLLSDLRGIIDRDVTVSPHGSDSRGDHLVVSGNIRTLATDLMTSVQSAVPGGAALGNQLKPQKVPSRVVTVDTWVKDGKLAEVSLDLLQFAQPGQAPAGAHVPLALTFSGTADDISAPSGATAVDLSQLGSLLGAFGGGASSGA